MAKNNTIDTLKPVPREAIAEVESEEDFVELMRRELDWPIPISIQRLEDVAIPHDLQSDFGFAPDEDRIAVSRLLNLSEEQPWGIFLFEFKTKRPYLTHLRRLIRVLSSQRSQSKGDPIWDKNDLIFICTPDWQSYQFVHFSGEKSESAVISSFGWDGPEDPFLHTLCKHNLARLRMPAAGPGSDYDPENWRAAWLEAFSVKPVTGEFYKILKEVFNAVQSGVQGLKGEEQRFFAELIVNRMVFLKFVEKKGWLNGDTNYLYNRYQEYGRKNFWQDFLSALFFEGLCKEKTDRTQKAADLLGDVPFLNAELFAPAKWSDGSDERDVKIENRVFSILFDKLLNPFNFTVTETSPLDVEVAFNQDLLGYGYEELIADQHGQGAYYTHPTEVNLMCRESLRPYLEGRCPGVDKDLIGRLVYAELSPDYEIDNKDALALFEALHEVTIVDPALGSGTFPVAMMKHLYLTIQTIGDYLKDSTEYKQKIEQGILTNYKDSFNLKLHIIERSLYGCDIDYFAVQIAKLRFWIELMVECNQPEALPNFDCKLVVGDALVSVVGKDKKGKLITLEDLLGHPTKAERQLSFGSAVIEELSKLKKAYFNVRDVNERARLKKEIDQKKHELLSIIGVDLSTIERSDKHVLWQIDFAEVFFGEQPGFDIAIANPPYLRQELIDISFQTIGIESNKKLMKQLFENNLSIKIDGKADLYLFFYMRTFMLLKQTGGVQCFICSNSWMDDDFGDSLQEIIVNNCHQALIFEDPYKRSFDSADINTVITIFQITTSKFQSIEYKFVRLDINKYKWLSNVQFTETSNNNNNVTQIKSIDDLFPVTLNGQRVKNGKWGAKYLRMPNYLQRILIDYKDSFTVLGKMCRFEYGSKPGIVDFFILDQSKIDEFKVEPEYLTPIITSTRAIECLVVNEKLINKKAFNCYKSKLDLKKSGCKGALDYIEWGETQLTTKKASHTKANIEWPKVKSVSTNRPHWYSYKLKKPGHFIVPALIRERFFYAYNKPKLHDTNMFYHGTFLTEDDLTLRCAVLNSTLMYIITEIYGRLNIGGRINLYATEYLQLPVLDVNLIDSVNKEKITLAFNRISERPILPIRKELNKTDRHSFDSCVLEAFGLLKEIQIDKLYDLFIRIVENRVNRERKDMVQ